MSFISFYLLGSFFSFVTSCFIYRYMKEDKYITHGISGYSYGCRCEVCREANTLAARVYRAKIKNL